MSLVALIKGRRGASGFGYASTAEEVTEGIDLTGTTAVITGSNSGLGQESARVLAKRGAHVLCLARSLDKAEAAADMVKGTPIACDLAEPATIQSAIESIKNLKRPIDIAIANAGIMALPTLTKKYDIEMQLLTNHFGHFLLLQGIMPLLSAKARVVVLSSSAHKMATRGLELDNLDGEQNYRAWRAYGRSKLANLLCAKELAKRLPNAGQSAFAVHPGVIRTKLGRHMGSVANGLYAASEKLFAKTVAQGAATSCYCATMPGIESMSGAYFADCNLAQPSRYGKDTALAEALWQSSEEVARRLTSV